MITIKELHAMIIARDVLVEQLFKLMGADSLATIWSNAVKEIDSALGGILGEDDVQPG